jgi:hypothetical protein
VRDIALSDNKLWAATTGGVVAWNLDDNSYTSYTTADESGYVWCATDGGISKFTGTSWVTYDTTKGVASNLVYKILIGSNNALYAATSKGISILKSDQWKTLKTINEPSHNNYTDMVVDKRGAVILAGGDHIAIYAVSPDLPYALYSHIIQDKSGTVWFGTEGSGVLAYKDNRWYQFTTRDGIPCNSIRSCAIDSKDNLWIHTDYGIAMRKSGGMVHNKVRRDLLNPGNKREIKQSGNRFYVPFKDKPSMIRYTLFDLHGRAVHRQTIPNRKFFVLPESSFPVGSGLRILSITIEDTDGSQNNYFLKISGIK